MIYSALEEGSASLDRRRKTVTLPDGNRLHVTAYVCRRLCIQEHESHASRELGTVDPCMNRTALDDHIAGLG
jgi:hypothetical protein